MAPLIAVTLFYQTGSIEPLPPHYEFLGIAAGDGEGGLTVELQTGPLGIGQQIAFAGAVCEEYIVGGLQVGARSVVEAACDERVLVRTEAPASHIQPGARVDRVRRTSAPVARR